MASIEKHVVPLGAAQGGELVEVTYDGRALTATVVIRCPNGERSEMVFQGFQHASNRNAEGIVVERLIEHLMLGGAAHSRFVFENQDGSRSLSITATATARPAPAPAPTTSWRDVVSGLVGDAKFNPPATAAEIEKAEGQLEVKLPEELRSLYLQTNGIIANYGASMVWPLAEMVAENETLREPANFAELYMPFDCLLFFGTEGNGDLFAYRILAGSIPDTSWIFEWDHETDNRMWFARDLADYFQRSVHKEESAG